MPPANDDPRPDDPTHALDGFAQRLREAAPGPAPMPDLDDLLAPLAGATAASPTAPAEPPRSRPRGGTLRGGMTWREDDISDATEVISTRPPADTPADLDAIGDLVKAASAQAAAAWATDAVAALEPVWQPDGQTLQLRPQRNPRLLDHWQPGAWIGAARQILDARTELVQTPTGPVIESHPPQRLLLVWSPPAPVAPAPMRWPAQVRLAAVPPDGVADALLALAPAEARLWLDRGGDDIDWALGAEIVLHHEAALNPAQTEALRAVIAATREAAFARLNDRYRQAQPGGPVVSR